MPRAIPYHTLTHSLNHENIRKPEVSRRFLMFSGGIKREKWHEMDLGIFKFQEM